MATLIVVALVLSLLHFVYEGILLPSIRLHLRFRTFELRDRLRMLANDEDKRLDLKIYDCIHDALNGTLRFLYKIDVRIALDIRRMLREDPTLAKRLQKRLKEVEACPVQEIHEIRKEHSRILACALLANSAGFFIMALPFLVVLLLIMFVLRRLNEAVERIHRYAGELVCAPDREFERKLNTREQAFA